MGKPTSKVTVTFDTNVFPASDLIKKAEELGYSISVVSVTERESQSCGFIAEIKPLKKVPETLVLGGSKLDATARLSIEHQPHGLELALKILSNGSFPPICSRKNITEGQKRMLRDAMILAAHSREGNDIFVTKDSKGFINHGRRKKIETTFQTEVLHLDEFESLLKRQGFANHSMNQTPVIETSKG